MSTQSLISELMEQVDSHSSENVIDLLHELLDDRTIDTASGPLGIAEAAELVGLTPHTLRYYERLGLVHPARNASGYREYSAFDLRRLVFITRMRVSGMTMDVLVHYIELVARGDTTKPERRQIMLAQRERIKHQLAELRLSLAATEYKIAVYTPES